MAVLFRLTAEGPIQTKPEVIDRAWEKNSVTQIKAKFLLSGNKRF